MTSPSPRSSRSQPRRSALLVASALVSMALGACTVVGAPGTPSTPAPAPVPEGPAIAEGDRSAARDRAAADLLADGEARLSAGDAPGARAVAREVAAQYPEARGSSAAYWLEARAERALGSWRAAEEAAARFVALSGTETPEGARAQLLRAEARYQEGRDGALEALFLLPETGEAELRVQGLELARGLAGRLDDAALRDLLEEAPRHRWLLPAFQVELGERRLLVGDPATARALADAALTLEPSTREEERARRILAGEVERSGAGVTGVLGAVLSAEGSPGLQGLSRQIRDGIEVALLEEGIRGGVRFEAAEDGGDPLRSAAALRSMESRGVMGVVGPLTDRGLVEAARERSGATVLISPTARLLPPGVTGIHSIAGVDPEAHRVLARQVWEDGIRQIVVFHRRGPEEEEEVRWFREAYEALGGQLLRSWSYAPGTTTLDEPLRAIAALRPRALLVVIPPEDVELVAPQLAFFGVDDVEGLHLYGNAAWATPGVLQSVPVRHTDGVRTVSAHGGDGFGPAWGRFSSAYESHFQRSLRSPVPALGWDAARLFFEAAALGGNRPDEVERGLTRIQNFEGATGTFSWRNGRLSRHYTPVRIENRTLHPLDQDR